MNLQGAIYLFTIMLPMCVVDDYLYFSASRGAGICNFYRSKNPVTEPFEEIPGSFTFWDPNLFYDDDGRLYFYWGCSNTKPIYGVELDRQTMKPLCEPATLIFSDNKKIGYERVGGDHVSPNNSAPYIEGAWVTKHDGKYYLQYAAPGTEYNIYADGVYVSNGVTRLINCTTRIWFSAKPVSVSAR